MEVIWVLLSLKPKCSIALLYINCRGILFASGYVRGWKAKTPVEPR